jgi:hypothetical protein
MPISDLYLAAPGNHESPLPGWALFIANIGVQVHATLQASRVVVAVALPTRAYAAALVASGITLTKAARPVDAANLNEHFLRLCQLPLGTRVVYLDHNRRHKGVLAGVVNVYGESRVRVQLTAGDKLSYLVSAGESGNIELADWEGELPHRESGRRIARRFGFIDAALGEIEPREFIAKSRLDVLIFGKLNALRAEILETPLSARLPNGHHVPGKFQDLIRVKSFSPTQAFRSEVHSDAANVLKLKRVDSSVIVVFDGPRAFLRLKETYRSNHWIVLLDRTSTIFQDAVEALNQEYMRARRADLLIDAPAGGKTWGVEVMAYQEPAG